jgi:hypothetical protein
MNLFVKEVINMSEKENIMRNRKKNKKKEKEEEKEKSQPRKTEFDFLKELHIKDLKIVEKHLTPVQAQKYTWKGDLDKELADFAVHVDPLSLRNGVLEIPVMRLDRFLPIQYIHSNGNVYPYFRLRVKTQIDIKIGDVLKVSQLFGVDVPRHSEEKHTIFLTTSKNEFYFYWSLVNEQMAFFKKEGLNIPKDITNQWIRTKDLKLWNQKYLGVCALQFSNEVRNAFYDYETAIRDIEVKMYDGPHYTYQDWHDFWKERLNKLILFFEKYRNLRIFDDETWSLHTKTFESGKKILEEYLLKKGKLFDAEERDLKDKLMTTLAPLFLKNDEGYYVTSDKRVIPNHTRFISLRQPPKENRNSESLELLEQTVIEKAGKNNTIKFIQLKSLTKNN